MPVDAVLTRDDRYWCERRGRVVDVEVAGHPIGVDVELNRALNPGRDHCASEAADSETLTGAPDELTVGADAERAACDRHLVADRRAPARCAAAGHRAVGHPVIDEQVEVLTHRGDPDA